MRTVSFITACIQMLIIPAVLAPAAYYVSSTGDDANPGTLAAPFKTIAKVNSIVFRSGDAVYFRGGDTFSGSISIDSSDTGSAAAPIVIGSYAGRAVINGGNGKGIVVSDTLGVRITNITVTGNGRKTGNTEDGIIINNSRAVDVINSEVYGFQHSGVRLYDSDSVRLVGVYAHDNGFAGIYAINPSMTVPSGWNNGLYIGYCITANNPGDPTVLNNHSGNGIVISCFRDVTIEYCESYTNGWDMPWTGNGPVGIWTFCVDRATIQYCISHDNRTGPSSTKDGGGFDLDGGTRNSVIQYCLSYNNDGTGYGIFQYSGAPDFFSNTVRYCVGYNDGKKVGAGGIRVWNGPNTISTFHDITVHNNTIYNTKSAAVYFINPIGNGRFVNNIFITKGAPYIGTSATAASHILRCNNYWDLDGRFEQDGYSNFSEWALAKNVEQYAGSIVGRFGDPKLQCIAVQPAITDPAFLSSFTNAMPLAASPVIDAGCDLMTMFGLPMGSRDLTGNDITMYGAFDIGACEYTNTVTPAAPIVSGAPASFTTNASFTVALDVNKNFGYYSTNGSAFIQFTAAGTSLIIDRTTTLRYYGATNGVSGTTNSATYTFDTAAPIVTGAPASLTTNAPFTVDLDVNENYGYYSTNGSAFIQFTAAGTSIIIDRTMTLSFFGRDTLGNTSTTNSRTYTLLASAITTLDRIYMQNNPCRKGDVIAIKDIPDGTRATIYTVSGRRIIELPLSAGIISWDLAFSDGRTVSPGVYLCHLRSSSAARVLKIMVRP